MNTLPERYKIGENGKQLNKKNFLTFSQTPAEKRRIRECLIRATLIHQLAGVEIPDLINDDYRCEVILHIDVLLSDLRHKDFIAKHFQPLFKPHTILRLLDNHGNYAYSYAHKRLNKNDDQTIVITQSYCTEIASTPFPELNFSALVNRTNKRDLYLETMGKSFLLDHPKIYQDAPSLMTASLWYRGDSIIHLFDQLTALKNLKAQKLKAKSNAAKASLNTEIKQAIQEIKKACPL